MNRIQKIVLGLVAVAVLAGGGAFFALNKGTDTNAPVSVTETAQATSSGDETANGASAIEPSTGASAESEKGAAATGFSTDTKTAMADRGLGNPDAPVRIDEYASLSCSHCAAFHENSFPAVKEQLIDTGKVYFVFHDFPLNPPALQAAMIARCMPSDKYFNFVSFLFKTQATWAFSENYSNLLRQNAKLAGMSDEVFDACINNESLKQELAGKVEAANAKYKIDSTPSFVLNDGASTLKGEVSVEGFNKAIEEIAKTGKTEE